MDLRINETFQIGAVRNADRMNQRRVRVLPHSESRRGEYTAKPHLPALGKPKNLIIKWKTQ